MLARKESDLGPPTVAWLHGQGFTDVYQEVDAWAGRADLVGVAGKLIAVVELKVALSWELLSQARRWRGVAHQVWVAVPHSKMSSGRQMAERVFEDYGIGVISGGYERSRPAFNRRADTHHVTKWLREEHKTFAAAGSCGGRHWTEFKSTCERLREHVAAHPGATMRECVAEVKHHYASDAGARSRLVSLIRRGVVAGIRVERDGRALRLYPAEAA